MPIGFSLILAPFTNTPQAPKYMGMVHQRANTVDAENPASNRSSHTLRGDYSHIGPDYSVAQPYAHYTPEEHDRWRRLYRRQMDLMPRYAAPEFLDCIARLDAAGGIPDFARVNQTLAELTGFKILAVPGLIPDDVFFDHLANRRFPVSWWIREESELDYLEEPDVFHDFFGHVPLLAHPVFADYMVEYGKAGPLAKAMNAIPLLSRLYWYTIEFGLIRTPKGLRVYGAGILSSKGETVYAVDSDKPNRIAFDLERVLHDRIPYRCLSGDLFRHQLVRAVVPRNAQAVRTPL